MAEAAQIILDPISTVDAIRLLTADISDQEFEKARADHPSWPATGHTKIEVPRDFIGEVFDRPASKRELAITLLTTALCAGELPLWTSDFVLITGPQLRTVTVLRDTIISGMIHAPMGALALHDGKDLVMSRTAFEAWLQARCPRPESAAAASTTSSTAAADSDITHPEAPTVDPFKSGAAGRPTAFAVVLVEAERRLRNGETKARFMNAFANELAIWWEEKRKTYPEPGPPLTAHSLENRLEFTGLWHRRDELRAR